MKELVSKTTRRRIGIIEYLSGIETWVSPKILAEKTHCSLKTLYKDLFFLQEHWEDQLNIEISKTKGIRMTTFGNSMIHSIYYKIYKNSDAFTFMEGLFFHPYQTEDFWIKELYFSDSSLYRVSNNLQIALNKERFAIRT